MNAAVAPSPRRRHGAAVVRLLQAREQLEERRLAAPGRADDRHRLAVANLELDAVQRDHGPEPAHQSLRC